MRPTWSCTGIQPTSSGCKARACRNARPNATSTQIATRLTFAVRIVISTRLRRLIQITYPTLAATTARSWKARRRLQALRRRHLLRSTATHALMAPTLVTQPSASSTSRTWSQISTRAPPCAMRASTHSRKSAAPEDVTAAALRRASHSASLRVGRLPPLRTVSWSPRVKAQQRWAHLTLPRHPRTAGDNFHPLLLR